MYLKQQKINSNSAVNSATSLLTINIYFEKSLFQNIQKNNQLVNKTYTIQTVLFTPFPPSFSILLNGLLQLITDRSFNSSLLLYKGN